MAALTKVKSFLEKKTIKQLMRGEDFAIKKKNLSGLLRPG